jgi:hypothetical protein
MEERLIQIHADIHKLDKKVDAILINNRYHTERIDKVEKRNDKLIAAVILAVVGFAAVHGPQVFAVIKVLL